MWDVKPLVEVTDLITCGVAKRPDYVENGVPFLSAKNVKNGEVVWEGFKFITQEMHESLTKKNKPIRGDILYTRVGSFGEAAIVETDDEFSVFVSLTLIKPKHSILNNKFLKYYLNSSEVKARAANSLSGSGVGNLNVGTVRKFPVPFPSLPEQKRIVAILDEAFAGIDQAIAHTEQNIQNARELFESTLNNIFTQKGEGWITEPLNQNVHFIDYRGKTPPKVEEGIRLITAKNVKMGYVQNHPEEFIDETVYDDWMTRGFPAEGDILFTTEAPLGNVAQLGTYSRVIIGQRLITMQPKEGLIDKRFLKYRIMSPHTQGEIHSKATGATVLGIKSKLLKLIPISYPSIDEQIHIADLLDEATHNRGKLEALYTQKLTALKELKQSLLQKAFAGELTAEDRQAA